jgi:large conductance mechanosensitive channel
MAMVKEFKDFLLKQNIVALALAVIVGTALNTLVKALVDDFIMPIIAALGPGGDWQTATWNVGSIKFGSKIFLKPAADVPMKDCPYCRMSINAAATRCANCTSQLAPA